MYFGLRRCRRPALWKPALFVSLLFLMNPVAALAQDKSSDDYPRFKFGGQFRLRTEADGRTAGEDPDFATLSRIRVGVNGYLEDWIGAYSQIQDSRAWGTEENTLFDASADLFDFHQAYIVLGREDEVFTKLGRQEVNLGDQRLVGAVAWSNTGRSFDGIRAMGNGGRIKWNAFALNVVERDSLLVIGLHPQLNQGQFDDGWLIGGSANTNFGDLTAELTALYDVNAATDKSFTTNLRAHGAAGLFIYDAGGAYQGGPDRSAYFLSGKAGVAPGKWTIAAQLDYLSGDDDPTDGDTKAFNTLYATNHKFYGYMDYFLAIPQQLDQAGLVDAMLRAAFQVNPTTVLRADLHRFNTAEERLGETALGTELDLVAGWRMHKDARLDGGGGIFAPEPLITQLLPAFAGGDKTTWWAYVQLIVSWP